jgi:hypothetical protein
LNWKPETLGMYFAFLLLLRVGHIGSVRPFFDGMTAFVPVSLLTSIVKTHGRYF